MADKLLFSVRNIFPYHFVHLKSQKEWLEIAARPAWY